MDALGVSIHELSKDTFIEEEVLGGVLGEELPFEALSEFNVSILCNALHINKRTLEKDYEDLLTQTESASDTVSSRQAKAKIQDYMEDLSFVDEVEREEEI